MIMKITRASNGKISNIRLNGLEFTVICLVAGAMAVVFTIPYDTIPGLWFIAATYLMLVWIAFILFMVGKISIKMSVMVD